MKTRIRTITELIRNKSVLHVGFADACFDNEAPDEYVFKRKIRMGIWLHDHIMLSARTCTGIDTDATAVNLLKQMGYGNIYYAYSAIEAMEFDYLVLGEVIEHIDNPVEFLSSLKKMFPKSSIIVTVPNAFRIKNFINCFFGKESINEDHRYWFTKTTLKKIMERSEWYNGNVYLVESYHRGIVKTLLLNIFPSFMDTVIYTT